MALSLWVQMHPDVPVPLAQQLPVLNPQTKGVGLAAGVDPLPAETLGASAASPAVSSVFRAGRSGWGAGVGSADPLVWEEQEPGEDAVRVGNAHHAIVVVHSQPHLVRSSQVEQHPPRADLHGVGLVVTEAGHPPLVLVQDDAEVGCVGVVEDEVVDPREPAGELACGGVVVMVGVGDDSVENHRDVL